MVLSCSFALIQQSTSGWSGASLLTTGVHKRKGAWPALALDFTARERDCYGCLCNESRAKLTSPLKATRRLLPAIYSGVWWGRRGGEKLHPAVAKNTLWRDLRVVRKLLKRLLARRNPAARLKFQQRVRGEPGGGVNRSQVLPCTCH